MERIVGERRYFVPAKGIDFFVRIGIPFQNDAGYYTCEWQFVGLPEGRPGQTNGADALDAVDNALWVVGTQLAGLNEALFDGQLQWAGGQPGEIGLPQIRGNAENFKRY